MNTEKKKTGKLKKIVLGAIVLFVLFIIICCMAGGGDDDSEETVENNSQANAVEVTDETEKAETAGGEMEDIETEESENVSPQITTAEEAREYMESCSWSTDYNDIMRYEGDYVGKDFAFFAKVSQVMTDGSLVVYDDADGDGNYTDNQYYIMDRRSLETTKILENDMITIYGSYVGIVELERAIGNSVISIPGFNMYLCDMEGVELKANGNAADNMDYSPYGEIILDEAANSEEGCGYTLYDIDGDGIKELITSIGTSNADWHQNVYTMDIYGRSGSIGTFDGSVLLYAAEDGNGIYSVYGVQGWQTVERITKEGGELRSAAVMEGEADEYYENDNPIPWHDMSDLSLLE